MPQKVILIIEDEAPIRDMLCFALEPAGFSVQAAPDTDSARQHIATLTPDLILLDWMLPKMSGIDFIKLLKQKNTTRDIPIIMLTARAEESNKLTGLEIGADDYITKPFSPRELIARIKTVLRRGLLISPQDVIQVNQLRLNIHTHQVTIEDQRLELTPTEYRLLHFFMTHKNRVYSREHLLDQVWGNAVYIDNRTVDVHIRRLRKRLKPANYDTYIHTIRGTGYQFSGKTI